jgi:excisionase family DNA binding protein
LAGEWLYIALAGVAATRHRDGYRPSPAMAVVLRELALLAEAQRADRGSGNGSALVPPPAATAEPVAICTREAAVLLGRSDRAVRKMVAVGHLPAVRSGNRWMIPLEAVEARRKVS